MKYDFNKRLCTLMSLPTGIANQYWDHIRSKASLESKIVHTAYLPVLPFVIFIIIFITRTSELSKKKE